MSECNELSKQILESKYYSEGESDPDDVFMRVAKVTAIPDVIDRLLEMKNLFHKDSHKVFSPYQDTAARVMERRKLMVDFEEDYKEVPVAKVVELWDEEAKKYFDAMTNLDFMPGTPTLINAGRPTGMLSSCFFLRVPDSMEGIMETNKQLALISKCLPEKTLIRTTNGLKHINKLSTKDCVFDRDGYARKVLEVIPTGKKELVKVITNKGIRIKLTKDHKLLCVTNSKHCYTKAHSTIVFKEIKDIDIESDRLVLGNLTVIEKEDEKLNWSYTYKGKTSKGHFSPKYVKIPNKITAELAWLLGYFVGDGSYHTDGIRFTVNATDCKELKDHTVKLLKKLFRTAVHVDDGGTRTTIAVYNIQVRAFFKWLLSKGKHSIPKQIINGSIKNRWAFISGLFDADGTAFESGYFSIGTSYKRLKDELICVFNSLGAHIGYLIQQGKYKDKNGKLIKCRKHYTLHPLTPNAWSQCFNNMKIIHKFRKNRVKINKVDPYGFGSFRGYNFIKIKEIKTISKKQNCYNLTIDRAHEYQVEQLVSKNSGGGVGLDVSTLRPRGAPVTTSAKGTSSGPVSFLKVFNETGNQVQQGGVRRAALIAIMSVDHPDIVEFIRCKEEEGVLSNFNISVLITDEFMKAVKDEPENLWGCDWGGTNYIINRETGIPEVYDGTDLVEVEEYYRVKDIWNLIIDKAWSNGEPGIIFWDELNRGDIFNNKFGKLGVNPCVVGTTKIAVADGRGDVPIKQLAEEGNDVPVFCTTDTGKLTVKYMRNSRLTGKNQPIYKVTLDDGSSLRVTKNHKFILEDGGVKEAIDLRSGDSLRIFTKFKASLTEIIKSVSAKTQDYQWIRYKNTNNIEHRFIAGFYNEIDLLKNWRLVVHHKDYNGLNNTPENLQVLSKNAHDELHRKDMLGDKNPMRRAQKEWSKDKWDTYRSNMSKATRGSKNGRYIPISKSKIEEHAINLTKSLGRRFSMKEWKKYCKENHIPADSQYRTAQLGNPYTLAKWAASKLSMENISEDPRVVKSYQNALQTGLDCYIKDGHLFVIKNCEYCKQPFEVSYYKREIGFCSRKCSIEKYNKDPVEIALRRKTRMNIWKKKKEKTRNMQCEVFNTLKMYVGRTPLKQEWAATCKAQNISTEISRKTSPFRSYNDLKVYAKGKNHKVASVKLDGFEDVYNGTVDDYHNYFIGGFPSTFNGKSSQVFVNTENCGEQPLLPYESCNLAAINLGKCWYYSEKDERNRIDYDKIKKLTELGVRFLDNVIDINNFPLPEIEEWTLKTRRMGLGTMGLHDLMLRKEIRYGSDESLTLIDNVYSVIAQTAQSTSTQLGALRGVPADLKEFNRRNSGLLTVQPTGTVSIICNQTSSGVEPVFQWEFTRKDSYGTHEMKHFMLADYPDDMPDYAVTALEVSPEEHVRIQAQIQKYIDSSISKTVNLPNSATREQVNNIFRLAYKTKCKSITIYRSGSRQTEVLIKEKEIKEEPIEESISKSQKPIIPRFRGPVLFGATFKINTPGGKAYITINEDDSGLREVFVHISKAGSEITTHVEAEGRLISHSLKHGIPATTIIGHLAGHKSNPIFDSGRSVKSVPDAVALVMREYLDRYEGFSEFIDKEPAKSTERATQLSGEISGELCPDCGEVMYHASGCNHCYCGFSQCG